MAQFSEDPLELERLEKERLEKERLEREKLEKERMEKQKMENKLYPNNMLFVIPSWGDLLGYPLLGTYQNHKVLRIHKDVVIFLSGYDYSIETPKGTYYFLFGLGFHYLKFELESGKYITDHRMLTGLVLSDFVYDHMATSKSVTLEDDRDVVISEKVIRIPIDLSYKSENHITFIKGALMRNFFIPNKDMFLDFLAHIRDVSTYQIPKHGHMILSTHRDFYDNILVSEKMRANPYKTYMDSAAGLGGIVFKADQILEEMISPANLQIIDGHVDYLKGIYANLDFDPMYLYSLLESASAVLKYDGPQIPTTPGTTPKQSIFASAADRMDAFTSWPPQFSRKAKKVIPTVPKPGDSSEYSEYMKKSKLRELDINNIDIPEYKQEHFELRTQKSDLVESKALPPPPAASFEQILLYLKKIIEQNYEMRSIGKAFEIARDTMRQIGISSATDQQKYIWEMSKYANIYLKKEPNLGLSQKDKEELNTRLNDWILEIEEEKRKERERLERMRLEEERRKKEQREREERTRRDMEIYQKEKEKRERLEKERQEMARLEKEKLEQAERERQEKIRAKQELLREEREEQEVIAKEKRELERLKRERKLKEKQAKQKAKKEKKLQKQKQKIAKQKLKEQEKLKNL